MVKIRSARGSGHATTPTIQVKVSALAGWPAGIREKGRYTAHHSHLPAESAKLVRWTTATPTNSTPEKLLPPRFHACHSCGHQAWYEIEDTATAVSPYPCPWCGGEAGTPAPYSVLSIACEECHGLRRSTRMAGIVKR